MLATGLGPAVAHGQEGEPEAPQLSKRPTLLQSSQPRYPPEAWDADAEGDVVLALDVDEEGRVLAAEVISTPGFGLETAALVASRALRFSPAEVDGEPVKVRIRYTFKFRKAEKGIEALPPAPVEQTDPRPKGTLVGHVIQRGTGRPLEGAEVYVLDLDRAILTDADGRFEARELAPGGYAVTIRLPQHWPFETVERVEPGDTLEVRYYIEPKRRERYKTVVWGSEGKAMVGRTSLADAEIYEVPGTLGDPIRVVMLMPGVSTGTTGIGYPIVRGVLPGDSRYEVDGIQVPMLYHLILGNAVVNPRFTTGITFQPGGYSVEHGQFPGALIQADAAEKPEARSTFADISILHASALHAQPITDDLGVIGAARYGTLGLIIEGLASNIVFRYWDYQAKAFYDLTADDEVQLIFFGASNEFGESDPKTGREDTITLGFHRAAARWRHRFSAGWSRATAELGTEGFQPNNTDAAVDPESGEGSGGQSAGGEIDATYRYAALRLAGGVTPVTGLELRAGAEVELQDFGFAPSEDVSSLQDGLTLGSYAELEWTPGPFTVQPGVRVDHYRYGLDAGPRQTGVDPRLALGWTVLEGLAVKAAVGVFQGPPRVTLVEGPVVIGPVPGLSGIGLDLGLTRSTQASAGVEVELPWRFEVAVQGHYSRLRSPLDFSLLGGLDVPCLGDACPQVDPEAPDASADDGPPPNTEGRSYGLEFLLRRRLGEDVFGWLSYSLSRSERDVDGIGTIPFAFDQTHVLNLVLSWDVGRHWTLGGAFHVHTGRPYTPLLRCIPPPGELPDPNACAAQIFAGRLPSFWRLDARIQKREVFETWYFDFYIDLVNVTFNSEVVGYEFGGNGEEVPVEVPVIVPMLGLRGEF